MVKENILAINMILTDELDEKVDYYDFSSDITLLDYDFVMISIDGLLHEYMQELSSFRGLDCLNDDNQSAKLVHDMERRKSEIIELLKTGNNIAVILPRHQYAYVRTGRKEYSGTGRNRQVTNIVDKYNLLSFLPIDIEITKASGRKISYVGNDNYILLKDIAKSDMQYNSYISKGDGTPLMQIGNTTKCVSMVYEYEKGKIILLPDIAPEESYGDEEKWDKGINRYIYALIELDKNLRNNINNYSLPEWSKKYLLPKELEYQRQSEIYKSEIKTLQVELEVQLEMIRKLQKKKLLFTSTGESLEDMCKEIFIELGFKMLDKELNRSDLVLKYGSKDIVVEIKGLTKSSGEKNAAQLEKWVSEHIENYGRHPKSILLVNAYKNIELGKRLEDVFPKQMLKYAINREQCLMTTTQLLGLYYDCMENPKDTKIKINEMLKTIGIYTKYNDFSKFLDILQD